MEMVVGTPASAGITSWLIWLVLVVIMTTSAATFAAAQTPAITFDLKIEKGRVEQTMRLIRVTQGDTVKLRWTTDRPITLHLHGYDIEKRVEPNAVTEMIFVARATGRFPVEEHRAHTGHAHEEAPLVRIEVRPR